MARKQSDAAAEARQAIADIPRELARLREMTVGQLRERYREVFGEPTRSRNKDYCAHRAIVIAQIAAS